MTATSHRLAASWVDMADALTTRVEAQVAASPLGSLPLVALIGAGGLFLVAMADTFARLQVPGAQVLFWAGYVSLVAPAAVRLLGTTASRSERLWLCTLVAMGIYGVKILHSPGSFALFDEFHHWATLNDITATGHLFTHNNILAASPFYPGLEIATSAITKAGGTVWDAGVLVVGAGRVLLALALFLFMERVTTSSRLASVVTLIYMGNPGMLFFDAQFAYESVALPLALFVLCCVVSRERGQWSGSFAMTLLILAGIATVVVTHHVTSILLAIFLTAWTVVTAVVHVVAAARDGADSHTTREPSQRTGAWDGFDSSGLVGPALICLTAAIAWMLYVASATVGYLAPAFAGALTQVVNLIQGEDSGRELFRSATGAAAPIEEQLVGYASVVVLLAGLVVGGYALRRGWLRNPLAITLGLIALGYPLALAGRFTPIGAELSARSSEFVFVGLAFLVGLGIIVVYDSIHPQRANPRLAPIRRHGRPLAVGAALVVLVGGAVLSLPAWARLPGPYLVSADPRSLEPNGIASARWMLDALGPDNRLMTDRTNRVLTKTYGLQHPISTLGDVVDVKPAYFDLALANDNRLLLRFFKVRYALIDERMASSLPYVGVYLERGEMSSVPWVKPVPVQALDKWNGLSGVDRVYDSGAIRLYDLTRLLAERP